MVQQEIVAFQCPDYVVEDPFGIEPAIRALGSDMGWPEPMIEMELQSRRSHQLARLVDDPDAYCSRAEELKDAYLYRLNQLLGRYR